MTEKIVDTTENRDGLGKTVSEKVAGLLSEIKNEPVPDRLMKLALELQDALNDKLDGQKG